MSPPSICPLCRKYRYVVPPNDRPLSLSLSLPLTVSDKRRKKGGRKEGSSQRWNGANRNLIHGQSESDFDRGGCIVVVVDRRVKSNSTRSETRRSPQRPQSTTVCLLPCRLYINSTSNDVCTSPCLKSRIGLLSESRTAVCAS